MASPHRWGKAVSQLGKTMAKNGYPPGMATYIIVMIALCVLACSLLRKCNKEEEEHFKDDEAAQETNYMI